MDYRLGPIDRQTKAATQVYRVLRRAILQGAVPVGTRLTEAELARQLETSRTPVREAMQRLEVEGLLQRKATGRVEVAHSDWDLDEIYGMRARIEGYAARLAATRATDLEIRHLTEVCHRGRRALESDSVEERAQLVEDFHRGLVEAAHSPRLARLAEEYRDYFLTQKTLGNYDRATIEEQWSEEMAIVDAVRDRDGDRAESAAMRHLENVSKVVRSAVEDGPRSSGAQGGTTISSGSLEGEGITLPASLSHDSG